MHHLEAQQFFERVEAAASMEQTVAGFDAERVFAPRLRTAGCAPRRGR
jgi:hypothetical protein